jgi:ankyrin repeat protein
MGLNPSDEDCIKIIDILKPSYINHQADNVSLSGMSQIESVSGVTGLHLAVTNKGIPVIEKLLRMGASPDSQDSNGETCLMYAAREGSSEKVKLLLDNGADPLIQTADGNTVSTMLLDSAACGLISEKLNETMIKSIRAGREITTILASRADPNCCAPDGTPCTVVALQSGSYASLIQLFEHSPNIEKIPTVLHELTTCPLSIEEKIEIGSELLFLKADITATKNGKTALETALNSGMSKNCDYVKFLIEHGADPAPLTVPVPGRIVRTRPPPPQNLAPGDESPSTGDMSPIPENPIDLSELAGRAGLLIVELSKAREFGQSIGGVLPPASSTTSGLSRIEDLHAEKRRLETTLDSLLIQFETMKSRNKNISNFRSIGAFLELQRMIADCRQTISDITNRIETGDYYVAPSVANPTSESPPSLQGWFRSPDSIEADIDQCIRSIRKATGSAIGIDRAIYEFCKKSRASGPEGIPVLKLLRNRGSDVSYRDNGMTPLMHACEAGNFDNVEWLLSNGADISAVEPSKGWTCLFFASARGHVQIVEKLVKRIVKGKGELEAAKWIITSDTNGKQALHYSISKGVSDLLVHAAEQTDDPSLMAA